MIQHGLEPVTADRPDESLHAPTLHVSLEGRRQRDGAPLEAHGRSTDGGSLPSPTCTRCGKGCRQRDGAPLEAHGRSMDGGSLPSSAVADMEKEGKEEETAGRIGPPWLRPSPTSPRQNWYTPTIQKWATPSFSDLHPFYNPRREVVPTCPIDAFTSADPLHRFLVDPTLPAGLLHRFPVDPLLRFSLRPRSYDFVRPYSVQTGQPIRPTRTPSYELTRLGADSPFCEIPSFSHVFPKWTKIFTRTERTRAGFNILRRC
jgi:hypothetical protein